ncbi:uncharacterized protein LOC124422081 [Vespa crabro]|uniref:uncharacterized protein LOC124422081 n=1 Tax=Vespa crabro TaxID=7445 RepID=UPI001F02EA28|nr:uncharacterized protein LOC124422081 [Vespa crabro]
MCNDFLPESVNAFLDDVETTTCLPILIIIVFCTLQFIFNHITDVGCVLSQTLQERSDNKEFDSARRANLINTLKEMLYNFIFKKHTESNLKASSNSFYKRNNNQYFISEI